MSISFPSRLATAQGLVFLTGILYLPYSHDLLSCYIAIQGDSHSVRCLQAPYSLLQLPHEVQIELPLPFWVVPEEDLEVTVNDTEVTVVVDGVMQLKRQYWQNEELATRQGSGYKVRESTSLAWKSRNFVLSFLVRSFHEQCLLGSSSTNKIHSTSPVVL